MTTSSTEGLPASERPNHASTVVTFTWPLRPHTPRGGAWTRPSLQRQA